MGKWTKHGYTCQVIIGHDPFKDLTVYLGIAKNPGPSFLASGIQSRESFSHVEGINLHLAQQQLYQYLSGVQLNFSLPRNYYWTDWQSFDRRINTRITRSRRVKPNTRTRNMENCIQIDTDLKYFSNNRSRIQKGHSGQHKQISITHLNAQSLRNRAHFTEIKKLSLEKDYDILTFSETWFNTSVTNASVALEGYNIFRLDRIRKSGGGVCAYVKASLKVKVLKDLTGSSNSGLQQLWLQIQHLHLKTFILGVAYRPPDCPISCLVDDLMPNYTQGLI